MQCNSYLILDVSNLFIWCFSLVMPCKDINVKLKQSRYRPGVAQRVPGS